MAIILKINLYLRLIKNSFYPLSQLKVGLKLGLRVKLVRKRGLLEIDQQTALKIECEGELGSQLKWNRANQRGVMLLT